jgi:ABC-type glycerol-3-phosphate transport system substrate-binding protein
MRTIVAMNSTLYRRSLGRNWYHSFVLTAAVVLSLQVLMACAGSSSQPQTGSTTSGNVTWWGWTPTVGKTADTYLTAFNKVYPNIHVTFRQITIAGYDAAIRPALQSSVGPDVFDVAPGGGIGSITYLSQFGIDMTPVVQNALGSDWKSKISPINISGMTINGKLAAMPVGSTFAGTLWINKAMFDKYGVQPPTDLQSWVNDCAVFKSHGVGCFVHGAGQVAFNQDTLQSISDSVQPGVWTQASAGQAKWTDPTIVKALTIWKEMFQDGIMEPGALGVQQYPDANNAFLSGKFAMVMMGTWYMTNTTPSLMTDAMSGAGVGTPTPFTAVAIPFPDVAGQGKTWLPYGDADYGLAVNSKSSQQGAAKTFVTWMTTSTSGQQVVANTLNEIAALKGVQPDWTSVSLVNASIQQPMLQALITKTGSSQEPRLSLVSSKLQQAIGVASQSVAAGQASPQDAATTLQTTMGT